MKDIPVFLLRELQAGPKVWCHLSNRQSSHLLEAVELAEKKQIHEY